MDSVTETRTFIWPQAGTPIRIKVKPKTTYVVELEQTKRGRPAGPAPDPGLSDRDIRFVPGRNVLIARIHNVGAAAVHNLEVIFYDGDPAAGGVELGRSLIPHIEGADDLHPKTVSTGVNWKPTREEHEIHVVIDPNDRIKDEITTFNNSAHTRVRPTRAERPTSEI